ncbi:MAG: DUF4197 domain-containing protein [Flavobacteriales bacterium]|nr:DUF4197 domain-containing protein [Bacteroidota bacterium]MCB9240706.1 DUF4197 domain-containing protein [Flavobacteriales bacterium]
MLKLGKTALIVGLTLTLTSCDTLLKTLETSGGLVSSITEDEAAGGLKEALQKGVLTGVDLLGKENGFFNNAAYKILLPPEVQEADQKIRNSMFSAAYAPYMDKLIAAMNKGAENAMEEAKPVFADAIKQMTIQDAVSIVTGGDGAATSYLENATTAQLKAKFQPIIAKSLEPLGINELWSNVSTGYKIATGKNVTTDLNAYVTERAMIGLFSEIRTQEDKIRENPVERTTALLKKVFKYADQQKATAQ